MTRLTSAQIPFHRWLRWLNLRPEEAPRTLLMLAFYLFSSIGILWFEFTAAALFLGEYSANALPWVYIASTAMGTGLGVLYSQIQKVLPLRRLITVIPLLMALPIFLFWLEVRGVIVFAYSVFLIRLWLEAIYTLNELNTSIAANQLFNIREIKRTFPIVSSGILIADIVSGFSLPLLRQLIGLENVLLAACLLLLVGAAILAYLSSRYRDFFPNLERRTSGSQSAPAAQRLQGPFQKYVVWVVAFFVMSQVLLLLIDFEYLSQLERRLADREGSIADFIALFSGTLGIFEVITQWFASSRAIERLGIFTVSALLPLLIISWSGLTLIGLVPVFVGVIVLKFADDLLRYTFIASTGPIIFQPLPALSRNRIQERVRGLAEPLAIGLTGAGFLATIWLCRRLLPNAEASFVAEVQTFVFLAEIMAFGLVWLLAVKVLRDRYLDLLVLSAERGQLVATRDMDTRSFKQAIIETIENPGVEVHKRASCIDLLANLDPRQAGEVLAPRLIELPVSLQQQSLDLMLRYPQLEYIEEVQQLIDQSPPPEVITGALRYIGLIAPNPDVRQLQPYLHPKTHPSARATAAALVLRRGNARQQAEATAVLRRMLTDREQELERVSSCRALRDALYLQALRIHIPGLLRDRSLRVRAAILETIAAVNLQEYYPSLVKALAYPSTRKAAMGAFVELGDDAVPLLVAIGTDAYRPTNVRASAWRILGQIGSGNALRELVEHVIVMWGPERRGLLRSLLLLSKEDGIEAVNEYLGRRGIEQLIGQELCFIAQIYAAELDVKAQDASWKEHGTADLLKRSLGDQRTDATNRLFLLMQFLYASDTIAAAAFNLQSQSSDSVARGLEILDNTVDLSVKTILLTLLDPNQPTLEHVKALSSLVPYQPMSASDRLRHLLELRPFLSDWSVACCYHLASDARWSIAPDQVLWGVRHPTGFVREAVLRYLAVASPAVLRSLLPQLKSDPDPLVMRQVRQLSQGLAAREAAS
ncbi:MAG: MFS transporter [Elainellaceae cyanobacterium]